MTRRPTVAGLMRLLGTVYFMALILGGVPLWNSMQNDIKEGLWTQVDDAALLGARLWEVNGRRLKMPNSPGGIRMTVLNASGDVEQDTLAPSAPFPNQRNFPEVQSALSGRLGRAQRLSSVLQDTFLFTAVPLYDGQGRVRGALRAGLSTRIMQERLDASRAAFLASFVAFGVLGIVLTGIVSRMLTRPLERLSEVVRSGGDNVLLPRSVPLEVSDLLDALRTMRRGLNEQYILLSDEHRRFEEILSKMNEGILLADPAGDLCYANPAALRILNVTDADTHAWPRDGTSLCARVLALFSEGRLDGRALLLRDVSRFVRLDRMRADFVANASHELRTPIAAVTNALEALELGAGEDAERRTIFLSGARRAADRLARLAEDLLQLSRAEHPLDEPECCDAVTATLQAVTNRMSAVAGRRQILRTSIPQGSLTVQMPEVDFMRVVGNLIDNASKYSPQGADIEVVVGERLSRVEVAVLDNGPGIDAADLNLIFERFYRADRSRASAGSGLGLSLVKVLVERSGGKVKAANRPEGGARIAFELPLLEESPQASASEPSAVPAPKPGPAFRSRS